MSGRQLSRRHVLKILATAALGYPACRRQVDVHGKSVVLILVDQLRKDAADRWMPAVGRLARRGILFDEMRSVSPWTYPSVISMMSGLYPQQHGADGHLSRNILTTFSSDVPQLQELLRAAGYRTAAFITNPFLHEWNPFKEGFDLFDAGFINNVGNRRLGYDAGVWIPERMFADSVNQAIMRHFEGQPYETPEFTYVHYIDVHGPWEGAPFPGSYEASIRFIDERIHEIYDYFTDRYAGELIFLVTSDHGRAVADDESIGEGPQWRKTKATLHDFNLRIPLVILPGGPVPGPRRVPGPCANTDILPTILEWLDRPVPYRVPGRSLLPEIRDEESLPPDRPLYAKSSAFGTLSDGIVYRGRKYIRFFDPESGELAARRVFDLERDPREAEPIAEEFGEAEALLAEAAGDQGLAFQARYETLSEELEDQLRSLGYLK